MSSGGAPTPAGTLMFIIKFLHTQSVKLNIMGIWEWGIHGKVSYYFGGCAQKMLVRGSTLSGHRMTTGSVL